MQGQTSVTDVDRAWAGLQPEDKAKFKRSREGIDEDLAWLLECGDSALGARGTLGGTIAALELGGHSGGTPNTDLYDDAQIGWGRHVYGDVERHRWLLSAWLALESATRETLLARYTAPPAQLRVEYGAPVATKEVSLGDLGCLPLKVAESAGALIIACKEPEPLNRKGTPDLPLRAQRRKVRAAALKAAREANEAAHAEWAESKAGADKMRTRSQRGSVPGGGK